MFEGKLKFQAHKHMHLEHGHWKRGTVADRKSKLVQQMAAQMSRLTSVSRSDQRNIDHEHIKKKNTFIIDRGGTNTNSHSHRGSATTASNNNRSSTSVTLAKKR